MYLKNVQQFIRVWLIYYFPPLHGYLSSLVPTHTQTRTHFEHILRIFLSFFSLASVCALNCNNEGFASVFQDEVAQPSETLSSEIPIKMSHLLYFFVIKSTEIRWEGESQDLSSKWPESIYDFHWTSALHIFHLSDSHVWRDSTNAPLSLRRKQMCHAEWE